MRSFLRAHPSAVRLGLPSALVALCLAAPGALAQTGAEPAPPDPPLGLVAETASALAPAAEASQQSSELRISGPTSTVDPGKHPVSVRLLADDRPVPDAEVLLQRRNGDTWESVARLRTDAEGLARTQLDLQRSTRLRAVHEGSSTRSAAVSREIVVQVTDFRQRAVRVAAAQEGDPYRRGGNGPDSFDCSGLVRYAYAQVGKDLPRTSADQERATRDIPRSEMKPGDLIFISSGGRVSHVGIYAGDGRFWDAPRSGGRVSLRKIWSDRYEVGRVD